MSAPAAQYTAHDGLALALAYLEDPSDVLCPCCKPKRGTMEVIGYLDTAELAAERAVRVAPEGEYTVVLYCHRCTRGVALDLSRWGGRE